MSWLKIIDRENSRNTELTALYYYNAILILRFDRFYAAGFQTELYEINPFSCDVSR